MKIYSYQEESGDFLDLKEVSIVGTNEELGELVKLLERAIEIRKSSESIDHIHLQDNWSGWDEENADVVISTG